MECNVFSYSTKPFDFEIGGRNQKTQVCLKGWERGGVADLESAREAFDIFVTMSLACFSMAGVLADNATTLPKSRAVPGVFGIFEDPKDANAPEPRPNALDAPAVGEAMEVTEGDAVLKGFLVPCDEVSPPCFLPSV